MNPITIPLLPLPSPGALVQLKSGGPVMTVEHVANGLIEVVYAGPDRVVRDRFEPVMLVAIGPRVSVRPEPTSMPGPGEARG